MNAIDSAYVKHSVERLHQGDIIRDFTIVEGVEVDAGGLETSTRHLPYCVVLTQDCDLEQDATNRSNNGPSHDKYLQSILLCPAYPAATFRQGEHLKGINLTMQRFNSSLWKQIKQNNNQRYHFLSREQPAQVPDLVLDFKHYFTASADTVSVDRMKSCYLATIGSLFRENLSDRFAHYLSRIGLPEVSALTVEK